MLTYLRGSFAATTVALLAVALIVLDLTDRGFRGWWVHRALTTDLVAGLLVLSITLLVVDQVVRRREFNDRSRAIAAQVAILMAQAASSTQAVAALLVAPVPDASASGDSVSGGLVSDGSDARNAASEELRTYTIMLLVMSPLLIEDPVSRGFLEQAQLLAGEMARVRALTSRVNPATISRARLDAALEQLQGQSAPLLHVLDLKAFFAADEDAEGASPQPGAPPSAREDS